MMSTSSKVNNCLISGFELDFQYKQTNADLQTCKNTMQKKHHNQRSIKIKGASQSEERHRRASHTEEHHNEKSITMRRASQSKENHDEKRISE